MRLEPTWVEVILGGVGPVSAHGDAGDVGLRAPITGAATRAVLGPLAIEVEGAVDGDGWRITWSIANIADHPEAVRSVRIGCAVIGASGPLRFWSHGYQSWSPNRVLRYGVDIDASLLGHAPRLLRAMHHADEERAEPGELRSELVCALSDGAGAVSVVGFLGGARHAGTFRLAPRDDIDRPTDPTRPAPADRPAVLVAEAFLGGAQLGPGEDRDLHTVVAMVGDDPVGMLASWARSAGAASGARTSSPYGVGWRPVRRTQATDTEVGFLEMLACARADDWPFRSVWVGDGYQASIGDWLQPSDGFISPVTELAAIIDGAGFEPGLWLAPFLLARGSAVAQEHPDWIAQWFRGGAPLVGMHDPRWGGTVYVLDTTRPDVLDHLESLGRSIAEAGFRHVKADFAFGPTAGGRYHNPGLTPAQRLRGGLAALRRGLGDGVTLLASGVPFGPAIGVVDSVQTGPNAYPSWRHDAVDFPTYDGYLRAKPAISHAVSGAVARAFQHRALWANDPDAVWLGEPTPLLSDEAAETWSRVVAWTGSAAMASGDLTRACPRARGRFDELVRVGRAADEEARAGRPTHVELRFGQRDHVWLRGEAGKLEVEIPTGRSEVRARPAAP